MDKKAKTKKLTRGEIAAGLKALGLKKNDIVLLHSAYTSLGPIDGDANTVIDAFLDVLGKGGTLVVPAFGKLGILTELVRARKGAVISNAPVGTLAAIGQRAKELMADHWYQTTAHGEGTPFLKIAKAGGKICLLGVDQDRNTMLHSVEALLELPYLGTATRTTVNPKGKQETRSWKYYPGPHRNFIELDKLFEECGAMVVGDIGQARVRVIQADMMLDLAQAAGRTDPAFVLCENPCCADCVRQRAAIFKDRMERQERFQLTASSQLAGRYVPEMIEKMQACGMTRIELDYLQGKSCAVLSAEQLKKAVDELAVAGIQVVGLRSYACPDDVAAFADKCKIAGIFRVIFPLITPAEAFAVFAKAGIVVDLIPVAMSALQAANAYAALQKAIPAKARKALGKIVFSPAQFVAAGEMPFLQSWGRGKFARTIGQLDLNDMKWNGETTLLAEGNGEIKELISINRCHNFSGYFLLTGACGDLHDRVADFEELLGHL